MEALGGKLHGLWYAFGDADGYLLVEVPDDVAFASAAIRIAATGAFTNISTTKLLTVEETLDALRQGGGLPYRAPARPDSSSSGSLQRPGRGQRPRRCWLDHLDAN